MPGAPEPRARGRRTHPRSLRQLWARRAPSLGVRALLAARAEAAPRGRGGSERWGSAAAPSPSPAPAPPPAASSPPRPLPAAPGLVVRRRVCACGRGAPALTQRAPGAQRSAGPAAGGPCTGTRGPRAADWTGRGRGGAWERAPCAGRSGGGHPRAGSRGWRDRGAAAGSQGGWKRKRGDILRMERSPKVGAACPVCRRTDLEALKDGEGF